MRRKFNTDGTPAHQAGGTGSSPVRRSTETAETLGRLGFREVDYDEAWTFTVRNHYSHSWNHNFGVANYGLTENGRLLGVAVYGHPMNPASRRSIADVDDDQFLELNRLWVSDECGGNTETWFMSAAHSRLRQRGVTLVQSFADGRLGVGTIYQAAGFGYYGHTETLFHEGCGATWHDVPFTNTSRAPGMVNRNLMHARGQLTTFIIHTYRYLKPLTKAAARRIKLTPQPYPKERAGQRHIPDYRPPAAQIARAYLIAQAIHHPEANVLGEYLETLPNHVGELNGARDNQYVADITSHPHASQCVLF